MPMTIPPDLHVLRNNTLLIAESIGKRSAKHDSPGISSATLLVITKLAEAAMAINQLASAEARAEAMETQA